MLIFSVYRNGMKGLYQRIDKLNLFLAGMSRHMRILKNNLRALTKQRIYCLGYRLLIARNRM